jgi:hypothetical protein
VGDDPMHLDANEEKRVVLQRIAGTSALMPAGQAKFRVRDTCIHARFCSENYSSPTKYSFNVNPNTLSADYELWICGDPDHYYLMPISLMRQIYDHPSAYVDHRHPKIRVVSVDIEKHCLTYARGGESLDLAPYFQSGLP